MNKILYIVCVLFFISTINGQEVINVNLNYRFEQSNNDFYWVESERYPLHKNNDKVELIKFDPYFICHNRNLCVTNYYLENSLKGNFDCYSLFDNSKLDSTEILNKVANMWYNSDHFDTIYNYDVDFFIQQKLVQKWLISDSFNIQTKNKFWIPIKTIDSLKAKEIFKIDISSDKPNKYNLNDESIVWVKQIEAIHPISNENGLAKLKQLLLTKPIIGINSWTFHNDVSKDHIKITDSTKLFKLLKSNENKIVGFSIKQILYFDNNSKSLNAETISISPVIEVHNYLDEFMYYKKICKIKTNDD